MSEDSSSTHPPKAPTLESDVWSYGIMLVQLATADLAAPYGALMTLQDAKEQV